MKERPTEHQIAAEMREDDRSMGAVIIMGAVAKWALFLIGVAVGLAAGGAL